MQLVDHVFAAFQAVKRGFGLLDSALSQKFVFLTFSSRIFSRMPLVRRSAFRSPYFQLYRTGHKVLVQDRSRNTFCLPLGDSRRGRGSHRTSIQNFVLVKRTSCSADTQVFACFSRSSLARTNTFDALVTEGK
jgi:hypothetical protein